jgi:hypothetical protein
VHAAAVFVDMAYKLTSVIKLRISVMDKNKNCLLFFFTFFKILVNKAMAAVCYLGAVVT